jgi:hypothetical protein
VRKERLLVWLMSQELDQVYNTVLTSASGKDQIAIVLSKKQHAASVNRTCLIALSDAWSAIGKSITYPSQLLVQTIALELGKHAC